MFGIFSQTEHEYFFPPGPESPNFLIKLEIPGHLILFSRNSWQ